MTIGRVRESVMFHCNNVSASYCPLLAGVLHNGPKSEEKLSEDCVADF